MLESLPDHIFRRTLFRPASWLYGAAVKLRARAYARGTWETVRLPVPVLCVGNLTVGGTGKTPGVIWLAGYLVKKGRRPAVITRGYGRPDENALLVVSDPRSVLADGAQAGDEALLLARRLPGVPVVAGADRALAGRRALEDFSPDVLVMDDGFQHFRLHRDMDLACLDASQDGALFRRGALLPAGRLREPLSGLARAGVVFLTKSDLASPEDLAFLKERAAELAPEATVVPVRYRVSLWDLGNPVKDAKGLPVLALSALARPEAFESSLRRLGAEVAAQRFRDHHVFTPWEREAALERARREGRRLVVTEKDRQRLPADFPCLVARLDWEPEDVRTKTGEPWTSRIDSLIA